MAGEVNKDNYIVIQGWMINDLKLKGNDLLVYAIIYGFSQTEEQVFNGSLQYLANWTRSTKQGVSKNLKSLVDKGFLTKIDKYINGVKFCEYYATKFNGVCNKVEQGMQQSLIPPMQQSLTNNIVLDNIDNNINNNIDNKKERKKETFDDLIEKYTSDNETRDLLQEWLKVRKVKRAALTNRAIELNLKKLENIANESNLSINDYLEEVIAKGWASFYVINNYNKNASKPYKREEIVPEWFNKEVKPSNYQDNEVNEIEEILKEFKDPDFETRKAALQERLKSKYGKA